MFYFILKRLCFYELGASAIPRIASEDLRRLSQFRPIGKKYEDCELRYYIPIASPGLLDCNLTESHGSGQVTMCN